MFLKSKNRWVESALWLTSATFLLFFCVDRYTGGQGEAGWLQLGPAEPAQLLGLTGEEVGYKRGEEIKEIGKTGESKENGDRAEEEINELFEVTGEETDQKIAEELLGNDNMLEETGELLEEKEELFVLTEDLLEKKEELFEETEDLLEEKEKIFEETEDILEEKEKIYEETKEVLEKKDELFEVLDSSQGRWDKSRVFQYHMFTHVSVDS